MVKFQWCKLFQDTFTEKAKLNPELNKTFKEFLILKSQNPTQPYGSRDASFSGEGNFNRAVPKLRHAHLMHDLNLCYTISGKDPTLIKLYGVFKHDEMGTGQPANIKRQKSVATAMANQTFTDMPTAQQQQQKSKNDSYKQSDWYRQQNK